MPSSENQGSSSRIPFPSFRRAIFAIRSDQIHSVECEQGGSSSQESGEDSGLKSFQRLVSARFSDLSVANGEEFLSVSWIRKLLDAYGDCQDEFRAVLCSSKEFVSKQPCDRILSDYFDMSIKALDICNATRDGIQKIHLWQRHLEIVVSALDPPQQRMVGEGHLRRARKALMDLTLVMLLDEKDTGSVFSNRNRSFGHHNRSKDHQNRSPRHSRSLSWSVSPSWSASKQLQLIANSLVLPTANEVAATNGLAILVFTMSHVLLLVLWAIVAAIPCQDRSLQINITIPGQFPWSRSLQILHSRIVEECKKRGRNSNGLLKEIHQIEKGVHHLSELLDSAQLPLPEQHKEGVRESVEKLSLICKTYQTELDPLERQLREVFRKIRTCRALGLEFLAKAAQS